MFEVGNRGRRTTVVGFMVRHASTTGEITSVSEDADGTTLIDVLFSDGAVKTYTENCIVTETSFA